MLNNPPAYVFVSLQETSLDIATLHRITDARGLQLPNRQIYYTKVYMRFCDPKSTKCIMAGLELLLNHLQHCLANKDLNTACLNLVILFKEVTISVQHLPRAC